MSDRPKAIFEIGPDWTVLGCWFMGDDAADYMGMAWAEKEQLYFRCRIRFHLDDKVWESQDVKRVQETQPVSDTPENREKIMELGRMIFEQGKGDLGPKAEGEFHTAEFVGPADEKAFIEWLVKQPFASATTPEEYKAKTGKPMPGLEDYET